MQVIRAGVLSDTHIPKVSPLFKEQVEACFSDVQVIFHAGDLTHCSILKEFDGKEVHAVHGNMCSFENHQVLPTKKVISFGGYKIGLIHKTGYSYDFQHLLVHEFDAVDCIIFGHTHQPFCQREGGILYVNPGSFMPTSRHGAPGTYAILECGEELRASIHQVRK